MAEESLTRPHMRIVYAPEFEKILKKYRKGDRRVFNQIVAQIEKIARQPEIGKPLRHVLKSRRRVHVGSFVLIYEFHNEELRFLDFDHHDRIYKS